MESHERTRFQEWVAIWLDKKKSTVKPTSLSIYTVNIRKHIMPCFGESYVEDIDESGFSISGEISMENEQSARTLCTFLRNLLIQEVRRNGEPLDVRALSGIFRYENSVLRISGYELPFDKMSTLLTKEI